MLLLMSIGMGCSCQRITFVRFKKHKETGCGQQQDMQQLVFESSIVFLIIIFIAMNGELCVLINA